MVKVTRIGACFSIRYRPEQSELGGGVGDETELRDLEMKGNSDTIKAQIPLEKDVPVIKEVSDGEENMNDELETIKTKEVSLGSGPTPEVGCSDDSTHQYVI